MCLQQVLLPRSHGSGTHNPDSGNCSDRFETVTFVRVPRPPLFIGRDGDVLLTSLFLGCTLGRAIKTIVASLTVIIFCLGCGSGITGPVAPVLSQVVPQTIPAGSKSTTLKVKGSNFSSEVVLLWNGAPLATTVVDPQTLTAMIGSSDLSTPSTAQLKVQDPQTRAESQTLPVVIAAATTGTPLAISTTALPQSVTGTPYTVSLAATGGTPAYTWSLASGQLPAGLILAANTGVISGTPTTAGTYSFVVAVADSSSPAQTTTSEMTLSVAAAQTTPLTPLTVITSSLPNGTTGTVYSSSLQANGGTGPYIWSITSGNLPAGLTLATNTGVLSGTPTASGSFQFAVTVTDSATTPQTSTSHLSFSIVAAGAPLSITPTTPSGAMLNQPYSATLNAAGGTAPYSWSITAGSLPSGLSLATSGAILGSPLQPEPSTSPPLLQTRQTRHKPNRLHSRSLLPLRHSPSQRRHSPQEPAAPATQTLCRP